MARVYVVTEGGVMTLPGASLRGKRGKNLLVYRECFKNGAAGKEAFLKPLS